jgi:hypothetical protein
MPSSRWRTRSPSHMIENAYEAWKKRTQAVHKGRKLRFRKVTDGHVLQARVSGLAEPRAALEDLVATFSTDQLALAEVFLVRSLADRKGDPAEARPDPRAPAEKDPPDAEAFWSALFDPKAPPPPSEDRRTRCPCPSGRGARDLRNVAYQSSLGSRESGTARPTWSNWRGRLEPVVNWYRGSALIINLWEKQRE